jgi:hypothetical protein
VASYRRSKAVRHREEDRLPRTTGGVLLGSKLTVFCRLSSMSRVRKDEGSSAALVKVSNGGKLGRRGGRPSAVTSLYSGFGKALGR